VEIMGLLLIDKAKWDSLPYGQLKKLCRLPESVELRPEGQLSEVQYLPPEWHDEVPPTYYAFCDARLTQTDGARILKFLAKKERVLEVEAVEMVAVDALEATSEPVEEAKVDLEALDALALPEEEIPTAYYFDSMPDLWGPV
jgi:hypothetical protein